MNISEIKDPAFLQKLDEKQLRRLCRELREFIIENVSHTGGHLSSNLGLVELTVALHRAFHSPEDKIIFDVGHQCYTHKLLTGRAAEFDTLRCIDGISGFQCRSESPHDCYEGGHAGTALSAALGFAMAREAKGEKNAVIAVVGDGAMGNGLSYEALNHIGDYQKPLIIILNDNRMSINTNVGALHNSLERIRLHRGYRSAKSRTKAALRRIPVVGDAMVHGVELVKEDLKRLYLRDGALFEEMGITYYGPVDGHDLGELDAFLRVAKEAEKPVLLHVVTEKGHGCDYCTDDPDGLWHGVGAFDAQSGRQSAASGTTPGKAVSTALLELAEKDERIYAITPAMTTGAHLTEFARKYPKRFIDAGIAEEHALVLANALAFSGMKPFVTIYSTFLQRGYDQINHDIARMGGAVVVGIDRCGVIGEDGVSHQGIFDVSLLLPLPGITLAQGKDAAESARLLATGFTMDSPFLLRYSKNTVPEQTLSMELLPVGRWERLYEGEVTVITYGDFVGEAQEARRMLSLDGIEMGLVNARFLKPFDEEMMTELLAEGKLLLVYEEVAAIGGLGSLLQQFAVEQESRTPVHVLALPDRWIYHGKRRELLHRMGLDAAGLRQTVREKLGKYRSIET